MLIHLNHQRLSRLVGLAMVVLTTILFSFPAAAFGGRHSPGRHGPHIIHGGHYPAYAAYRHRHAYRHAPYYRYHRDYRYHRAGYYCLGLLTGIIGSSLYHSNAYPRPVVANYTVIDPPREVVVREVLVTTKDSGGRVVVTAPRLNVRSGPGRGYTVIGVIDQGTSLDVAGNAPGWLYVDLGDGRHGWVQQAYTAALPASANG